MSGRKLLQAIIRWPLVLMFATIVTIVLMPQAAYAAVSPLCPTQTPTVANGGSVTIDVSNCDGGFNFGMGGPYPNVTANGSITLSPQSGPGTQTVTYVHNGNSATSDTFYLEDENGDTLTFNVAILPPTSSIIVSPASLPTLVAGTFINQNLTATGGTAPYTFSLNGGALPIGLSLSSTGLLSGTPTNRGIYAFSVRVQDSLGAFTNKGYNGSVANPPLSITPTGATAGQGVPFSQALTAVGGVAPHSYLLETGSLPAGINFSPAGVISGTTAAAPGSFPLTVRVTDSSTGSGAWFELETFTLTVAALPTVSIAVAPASIAEDSATNFIYTVTRSATSTSALTVNLTTGGTATSGTDYTGAVSTVTIPANATTASFTIDPTPDANIEVNETIILTVAAGSGYTIGTPAIATGTILNDDVPSATVAVAPASVLEDGAANLVYTVTLNQPASNSITVNYSLSGSATSGTDYVASPGVVTFAPGITTAVIGVDPTADASIEANESVTVTLNAGAGYTVGAPGSATGIISNDDLPTLTINDVTLTEGNSGTTNSTFTVSLSAPAGPSGVTFDITTAAGTATSGIDYVTRTLAAQTIPAGSSTYSFTVLINGDSLSEPNEIFFVNVTNVTNAIIGDGQGLGTINNDDVPTASITVAPASILEDGATNLIYTVALDAAAAAPITVNFTLGGTATNGNDYNSTGSSIVIPAGTTSQTIVINPNPNGTIEPDETVIITLAAGTGYIVGAPASATGTILNDDLPSLFIDSVSVAEGNSGTTNAVFTISLSAPATAPGVTFDIATANWFALAGQDYVANSQTGVSIPAGSSSTTFTVVLNGDALNELDEGFFVRITNVTGAFVGGSQGIGTITNDDPLPVLSISSPSVVEGNSGTSTLSFLITLDAPSAQTVSANVATANGTAAAGSDYAAATGSFAFQPGETSKVFSVTVNGDTAPESDEVFTAALSGVVNATVGNGTGTGTIINDDVPLTILPAILPNGSVGNFYSAILTTSGGTAPYSYAITTGTVPAGLTLSADGILAGTPVAAGNSTFTIRAQDSSGAPGPNASSQTFTVTIAAPVIALTPVSLPNATFGLPYNQTITADGSIAPYSFAVTSGSLPPGLTLALNGTLSGTPTVGGLRTFTVTATDATAAPGPYAGGRAYTLTVDVPPLVIPMTTLPDGATDNAYSAQIDSAAGGVAPYSYAVTSGDLPFGVSMSSTGAITGTPSTAGLFSFVVTATDSNTGSGPSVAQQSYTINIVNTPPMANPVTTNVAYGAGLTPVPLSITGTANSVSVITPPANGRAIVDRMTISYIPDTGFAGADSFTYIASNNGANSAPALATINVGDAVITITPAGPLTATVGTPFNQTLTFNGGTQPFTNYQVTGLPAGLQLGSSSTNNVAIIGTPTRSGNFTLIVSAIDSSTGNGPFTASATVTLTVGAPNLILTPGTGTFPAAFNAAVSQEFVASGGTGNYSYAVTSGTLPSGVTFDGARGILSGRTVSVGNFAFTVTATDNGANGAGAPFTVSADYILAIAPPVIAIDQTTLPSATVATSYSQMITASGGIDPYSFAITSGTLPAGVTLSNSGLLSGMPGAGGNFAFIVTATDASGAPGPFTASQSFNLTVSAPALTLPVATLTSGQVGSAYGAALSPATGGTAPYNYAVTGGALPPGITLSVNGMLSGTPSAFGTFSFAVTATDSSTGSGPYTANQNYTISIINQPPVAEPVSVNRAYGSGNASVALNLSGGAANSVAIETGPANGTATVSGLTISYQPNASFSGTDSFSYTATNAGGTSSPAIVTVTVGTPTLTITPANPLTAAVGQAYSQTFSFAGGTEPFGSYNVTGLPAGLLLTGSTSNDVTIAGSPSAQGNFALTVSATDASTGSGPFSISQTFSLAVAGPNLVLAPNGGSFSASYAAPYSQGFTASGGVGPYNYALTGNLPAGVTLNSSTGAVSGTPTASGSFAFTITATDTGATGNGAPFTVAGNYAVIVAAPVITVTPTALTAAIAGQNYAATLTATGAVGPYNYTLIGGALPTGITLAASGQLSGIASASGSFPFIAQVRDANGQTASVNLTLNVDVPTLTLTPATLPVATQGIAYSQALTASGGIAPYSFTVTTGALPAGLVLNTSTGVISGTPTASGSANFAITVSDSTGGNPAMLTVNFALQVTPRPDPALDPEVRGLVQAQVAATRRFADAQIDNFMQRMESMHGHSTNQGNGDGPGFSFHNNVRFSTPDYCSDAITMTTNTDCENRSRLKGIVPLNNWSANASMPAAGAAANEGSDGGGSGAGAPVTIWVGGAIRFGERDAASGRVSQDFESEGITIGADYRFSPSFAAGIGIGLGRDTVGVGDEGSQSRGEAKTIAFYASHQFGKGFFVDWLGGYQKLDFDLRRYVTLSGALVNSRRTGHQWFGTMTAGADIERGNWQLTPYARLDITRATLSGYSESTGSMFDLAFLEQNVDFTSIGAGARFRYRHKTRWGELLPQLRAEYKWNVERSADALVAYTDQTSGPFSNISLPGIGREELTLGGKVEMLFVPDWGLALEYIGRFSAGAGTDNMIQIGIKHEF